MSSIVESLYRQRLIQDKNSLTSEIIRNSDAMRRGSASAEVSRSIAQDQLAYTKAQLKAMDKSKKGNKARAVDFYA